MAEEEPKHPYVTRENAKVHLGFSIAVTIMSIIQIILGIVVSELEIKEIAYDFRGDYKNGYSYDGLFHDWFHGDHVWVGFTGLMLSVLGFSVYHTRARANGVMLSIMLFISGFVIYPIAAGLGGWFEYYRDSPYSDGIDSTRIGSAIYTGIQAVVIITWAFYAAFHACCNSKVRKQTRLNISGAGAAQQPVYVQQPVQYVGGQQPVQYVGGQQPVQYVGGQQPVQYVGGQQPVQYVGGQQPVYVVQGAQPPQYVPQAQVPVQVQHVAATSASPTPDYNPPSYSES